MKNRILALIMTACLVTSMFVVSGSAANLTGTADITFLSGSSTQQVVSFTFPHMSDVTKNGSGSTQKKFYSLNVPPSVALNASGSLSVYFSYYITSSMSLSYAGNATNVEEYASVLSDPSSWGAYYFDANGITADDAPESKAASIFTPTGTHVSPGVTVKITFNSVELATGLHVDCLNLCSAGGTGNVQWVVPSLQVIATESSADTLALENIANQIAEGNAIAQAMYGDIMAALNAIKGDTSEVAAYMKEALTALAGIKSDTANIYSLCSSYLHYLAQIAADTSSIDAELKAYHEDFMTMMETLQDTVIDESGNIQDKMEEIYNLLIAYLDTQFASAINPDLQESTGNVQLDIETQEGLEQGFQSDLTSSWTDLKLETFALGGGYTSAIAWVSSWFSNFYNAMGDYGMIVMLPLYIGIVTLIAGLARQAIRRSGNRSSKSGGGEKGA